MKYNSHMLVRLIIHPRLDSRQDKLGFLLSQNNFTNPHPDLFYLSDKEKLGVEETKKIKEYLSFKPYQAKGRAVVIESAHNLSLDAQNSLLKLLEEPPPQSLLLLGASSTSSLISTILSRVEIETLPLEKLTLSNKDQEQIKRLISASLPERFVYVEKLKDKEALLDKLLLYFHQELPSSPSYAKFLGQLLEAKKFQAANVNSRAILEYVMLLLPS